MSLMGKIFTLLIFFMSICFLVIAVMVGATHRPWKKIAADYRKQAETAEKIADDAKSKTTEADKLLESIRVTNAGQIAVLESQRKAANEKLAAQTQLLKQEQIKSQERLRRLEQAENRLAQRDAEVEELKAATAKLAADVADKYSLVRSLTSETYELKNRVADLKKLNEDLSATIASYQKVMKRMGIDENSLVDAIPPKLDGVVTAIGDSRDLIGIALGTDDGLRVGHVLDVYRGDRFIGKVTVTKTDYNISVARTNKDFMQDQVQKGDHVTTKF